MDSTAFYAMGMLMNEISNIEREKSRNGQKEQNTKKNKIISEGWEPDDYWKCLFTIGIILIYFTMIRPTSIIFGDFLETSGQASIELSFFFSFFTIGFSIAGLVIKISTKIYFFTFVGFVGMILFLISSIIMACARNIYVWAFAYFSQGLAIGIMQTVTIMIFSTLFGKDRERAFYACHAIIGLIKMASPNDIKIWMGSYDICGSVITMDIMTSAFAIFIIAIMLPVRSIYAEKTSEKTQSQKVAVSNPCSTTDVISVSTRTESVPTLKNKRNEKIQEKKQDEKQSTEKDQKEYKEILRELGDMLLVEKYSFLNLYFAVSFVCFADNFFSFFPLLMGNMGYTKDKVWSFFLSDGTAEMLSNSLLVILTFKVDVKPKYLFFGAIIVMLFAKLGFLLCQHTLTGVLITTLIIGFVRSWLLVLQPLVIIDNIRTEKIATAYALYGIINRLVALAIKSIVGLVINWTGSSSFEKYQIILLVLYGTSIILCSLQIFFVDLRNKRKQRAYKTTTKSLLIAHI